ARGRPREVVTPGPAPEPLRSRYRDAAYSTRAEPASRDVLAPLGDASAPGAGDVLARRAASLAYDYAQATQPNATLPISRLAFYQASDYLVLDDATRANLELYETLIGRQRRGSLLGLIDQTESAPGGRLLRSWLGFPLRDVAEIRRRQDAVEL